MRLGLSSYTYAWALGVPGYPPPPRPMTHEALLRKAAAQGVRVVQIADNLPIDRLPAGRVEELLGVAAELGITIELGTSGIAREHLLRQLELAVKVGSPILRLVIDTADHRPTPTEAASMLREVAPEFARRGVKLAVENHDRFDAPTLAGVLESVRSPAVGVCLDTANSIACLETPQRVTEVLGPWVVGLHVKDFEIVRAPHQKGFVVEGRPAGQGRLDVPWLLSALKEMGRDPNAILELWPPPAKTIEETVAIEEDWARQSLQYLRGLIPD